MKGRVALQLFYPATRPLFFDWDRTWATPIVKKPQHDKLPTAYLSARKVPHNTPKMEP